MASSVYGMPMTLIIILLLMIFVSFIAKYNWEMQDQTEICGWENIKSWNKQIYVQLVICLFLRLTYKTQGRIKPFMKFRLFIN